MAAPRTRGLLAPIWHLSSRAGPSSSPTLPLPRHLHSSLPLLKARQNPKHASPSSSAADQAPRNQRIPYRTVRLVSPETNSLSAPQTLLSILRSVDPETHDVVLVSTKNDSSGEIPIVKLINCEEEDRKARELEVKNKLRRKTAMEEKEVQVSWSSADGDLHHKLDISRTILGKGDRVQLIFAPRSGAGGANSDPGGDRKEEIVEIFEEGLGGDGSAAKWRDDQVTKATRVQYWQATEGVLMEKKKKVLEGEEEKKREKLEKKEARRSKEEERRRRAQGQAQRQWQGEVQGDVQKSGDSVYFELDS